jgi:hypothetical protein
VFHLPTSSVAADLAGMKRSSRGALVQVEPNRRRQKLRESVFVTPLFPLNPPSHFIILSNSGAYLLMHHMQPIFSQLSSTLSIAISDFRYQLPNLLHNSFCDGDMTMFRSLLMEHCIPDLQYINQCDGMHNPYGPMTRELKGKK